MYEFYYDFLKVKYGEKCKLVYTDTDSLIIQVETEDLYKDMADHKDKFDFSNYPQNHTLYDDTNKKVIGKFKDELGGEPIKKVIALRPKMYSILSLQQSIKRAKGVKKYITQRLHLEDYKNALKGDEASHEMNYIRSYKHQLNTVSVQKTTISPFDTKRYLLNSIDTLFYGHYKIK